MKYYIFFFFFCGIIVSGQAQRASVEKSTFGIQTGILGVWAHNESRLSNSIALRTEIGFDLGLRGGSFYDKTFFLATPIFTVSPRWYYNIEKRQQRSHNTDGNASNFVALNASFRPDWFAISNYDGRRNVNDLSVIPTWGLRRNISKHFNYEVAFGLGYVYYFAKQAGYDENDGAVAVNLHLRIGCRF